MKKIREKSILILLLLWVGMSPAAMVTEGLIIHLDAGTLSGLADGAAVSNWTDSATGDSVDGSAAASAGYGLPTYAAAGLNGKPVVRFIRSESDLLLSSDWTLPNPSQGLTVIVVCTGGNSGLVERAVQVGASAGTASHLIAADVSTNTSGCRYNDGFSLSYTGSNPATPGVFHIGIRQMAQGGRHDSLYYAVNDLEPEPLNSNNPAYTVTFDSYNNHISLGNGRSPNGSWYPDFYNGDLAEVLVYNAQLTQAQLSQTCRYLADKHGLAFASADIVVSQSANETVVSEGGYPDDLTVTLLANPGGYPVTINLYDTLDPDQVAIDPPLIVFTSGDWQAPRVIQVAAIDDDALERAMHETSLAFEVLADPASPYYGNSLGEIQVVVEENDCGAWGFNRADYNLDCRVDLEDFAYWAQDWFECSEPDMDCQSF